MNVVAELMPAPALPVAANADADFYQLMNRPATTGSVNHLMFDDAKMNRMIKTAEIMATGKTTVPQHLRGSLGDCMAIVIQAAQWDMNPFSVAQKTHLVNGTLGYEAQLVNAVIITRAPIVARPKFEWEGDWSKVNGRVEKSDALAVTVTATFIGDSQPTPLRISMAQAGVRNSPLWESDPKQQLAYLAIKRWARLYCPDVLLGVYSADELDAPEPPPAPPQSSASSRAEALKQKLRESVAPAPALAPVTRPAAAINPDYPPPEGMNPETGEISPPDIDPIADLILAISESQTREELETYHATVAGLKNGLKDRAVTAWKEALSRIRQAAKA